MGDSNYTAYMENSLLELRECDKEEAEYSDIIDFLNTDFRSFGDGLKEFLGVRKEAGKEEIRKHLESSCKKMGMEISDIASRNTLNDWFEKGVRPKKGKKARSSMFALSFALRLSVEQTIHLFHKVYLDRAFNYRDYEEIIYYYCLKNGFSYKRAQALMEKAKEILLEDALAENTMYTSLIQAELDGITEDKDLLNYIKEHQYNLSIEKNNQSAWKQLQICKEAAQTIARQEVEIERQYLEGVYENKNLNSSNFLYECILGKEFFITGQDSGTKTVRFKSNILQKEIKSNFPNSKNLIEKNQSFDELRKVLILLKSYSFWYLQTKNKGCEDSIIDAYQCEMNAVLYYANMAPLYYGNPYDWLFLYCSHADDPLNTFRLIMDEVLEDE